MIRANLLPRPKERVGFGGLDIDTAYLRQALFGFIIVAAVTAIGIGIEALRLTRMETAAASQDVLIFSHAAQRANAKTLALEVARYQSFAREAQAFQRSGADAAIAIAQIGNSVPPRVWLNSLEQQAAGYAVSGASDSVDEVGRTMLSLTRAMPGMNATLVNIDNRENTNDGMHFTARLGAPATASPAVPRLSEASPAGLLPKPPAAIVPAAGPQ